MIRRGWRAYKIASQAKGVTANDQVTVPTAQPTTPVLSSASAPDSTAAPTDAKSRRPLQPKPRKILKSKPSTAAEAGGTAAGVSAGPIDLFEYDRAGFQGFARRAECGR